MTEQSLLKLTQREIEFLDVLFLAKYPPTPGAPPPPRVDPKLGRERLTKYEVFTALTSLGLKVASIETLEEFGTYAGPANYVFCLFNRDDIVNPETVVASMCTQKRLAYLGAPPTIRALAEDKYLTKAVASMAGLPVHSGRVYVDLDDLAAAPEFPGPYFVKPRFGANSEHIDSESAQESWVGASAVAARLIEIGEEVLVESLIDGRDITVTVLAATPNMALTPTLFQSELPYGIATERQKRLLDGGRSGQPLEEPVLGERLKELALRFADHAKPFDYMRVDFRQSLPDGRLFLMECNLNSNLGTHAATGIAIAHDGIAHGDLIEHLVAHSVRRQRVFETR